MGSLPLGFPGSSAGKESACHAGDPGSIPGSGRCLEEQIGYALLYSWASLVAQMVKNPPAMQETWAQSLGWKDLMEEGMATHSSVLALEPQEERSLVGSESDPAEQMSRGTVLPRKPHRASRPVKSDGVDQKARPNRILCRRYPFKIQRHTQIKSERMKKDKTS